MYYATELFIKKTPLGKIWLAGTVFKKLSKKAIIDSDISVLCDSVRNPPVALAISTCGRLTLGIVRIYDKNVHYLLIDANDAQTQLRRLAIRASKKTANIDLPDAQIKAKEDQITMKQKDKRDANDRDEEVLAGALGVQKGVTIGNYLEQLAASDGNEADLNIMADQRGVQMPGAARGGLDEREISIGSDIQIGQIGQIGQMAHGIGADQDIDILIDPKDMEQQIDIDFDDIGLEIEAPKEASSDGMMIPEPASVSAASLTDHEIAQQPQIIQPMQPIPPIQPPSHPPSAASIEPMIPGPRIASSMSAESSVGLSIPPEARQRSPQRSMTPTQPRARREREARERKEEPPAGAPQPPAAGVEPAPVEVDGVAPESPEEDLTDEERERRARARERARERQRQREREREAEDSEQERERERARERARERRRAVAEEKEEAERAARFARDPTIEFQNRENLINDENEHEFLVDRPVNLSYGERSLEDGDYEYMMTHSLDRNYLPHYGEYGAIYERFNNYLLHPHLAQRDMNEEYAQLERERGEEPIEPARGASIAGSGIGVGVPGAEGPPSIASSIPSMEAPGGPGPVDAIPPDGVGVPSVEAGRGIIPTGSREPEYSASGSVPALPGLWRLVELEDEAGEAEGEEPPRKRRRVSKSASPVSGEIDERERYDEFDGIIIDNLESIQAMADPWESGISSSEQEKRQSSILNKKKEIWQRLNLQKLHGIRPLQPEVDVELPRISERREDGGVTSSSAATVPCELSLLSQRLARLIYDAFEEMKRDPTFDGDERNLRINLEETLENAATQRGATLSKRDTGLGFLQVLILKNEDIIQVSQDEFYQAIMIEKGPGWDAFCNQFIHEHDSA